MVLFIIETTSFICDSRRFVYIIYSISVIWFLMEVIFLGFWMHRFCPCLTTRKWKMMCEKSIYHGNEEEKNTLDFGCFSLSVLFSYALCLLNARLVNKLPISIFVQTIIINNAVVSDSNSKFEFQTNFGNKFYKNSIYFDARYNNPTKKLERSL